MRLWSIHPRYLDPKGLVALWRESLLAQKVLSGSTKGYKNHPQLVRFKSCKVPLSSIGYYLLQIWKESQKRGYNFNREKIIKPVYRVKPIEITDGQISFECRHLKRKLRRRAPDFYRAILKSESIETNPLFVIVAGKKADWEK